MAIEQLLKGVMDATPSVRRKVKDVLKGVAVERGNEDNDARLVTITQTAKLLNIVRATVYKLIKSGRLDVVQLNNSQRVTMKSINEFVAGERPTNEATEKLIEEAKKRYVSRSRKNAKHNTESIHTTPETEDK